MPLYALLWNDHHPHDERSTRLDYYVVLSGGLEVGCFHRIGSGPSEGRWSWGAAISTDDTIFTAGGYAAQPETCCTLIALAFRRTLVRADLSERATHGPERWSWSMTGVSRPHDAGFVWRGYRLETEHEAFAALASCWARWLDWAGLEQVVPLQRG